MFFDKFKVISTVKYTCNQLSTVVIGFLPNRLHCKTPLYKVLYRFVISSTVFYKKEGYTHSNNKERRDRQKQGTDKWVYPKK